MSRAHRLQLEYSKNRILFNPFFSQLYINSGPSDLHKIWRNPILFIATSSSGNVIQLKNKITATIFFIAALGLPGWMGLDRSATVAIVLALVLLTAALGTAYKLYYCRRNRELRNDELRTANTGQYHGM